MPPRPDQSGQLLKPRLLLGEGIDEVHFFSALIAHLKIDDLQVEQYGGKNKLTHYLRELPKRPGFDRIRALGVTRDADTDLQGAFMSVCDLLRGNGFTPPARPGEVQHGLVNVGVFLLPDNSRPGMLEDLCMDSLASDPGMICVDEFLDCVRDRANRQPNNRSKARLQSWLASQVEPGKRLGEAARAGYWPWDDPAFESLLRFLHLL